MTSLINKTWTAIKNSSWGEEHKANFGDNKGFVICSSNGRESVAHATVFIAHGYTAKEIEEAARLIAAAPDLLAAALKIQSELQTEGLLQESYDILEDAINKFKNGS